MLLSNKYFEQHKCKCTQITADVCLTVMLYSGWMTYSENHLTYAQIPMFKYIFQRYSSTGENTNVLECNYHFLASYLSEYECISRRGPTLRCSFPWWLSESSWLLENNLIPQQPLLQLNIRWLHQSAQATAARGSREKGRERERDDREGGTDDNSKLYLWEFLFANLLFLWLNTHFMHASIAKVCHINKMLTLLHKVSCAFAHIIFVDGSSRRPSVSNLSLLNFCKLQSSTHVKLLNSTKSYKL